MKDSTLLVKTPQTSKVLGIRPCKPLLNIKDNRPSSLPGQLKAIINGTGKLTTQLSAKSDANREWIKHVEDYDDAKTSFSTILGNIAFADRDSEKAEGLKHVAIETRRAAKQHYNEIDYVAQNLASGMRLGQSNIYEPDALIPSATNPKYVEIKTCDTEHPTDVDRLVANGLDQLQQGYTPGSTLRLVVYLNNKSNYWPFTLHDQRLYSAGGFLGTMDARTCFPAKAPFNRGILNVEVQVIKKDKAINSTHNQTF